MTKAGEQLAAQIQDELACPNCSYSLRGLAGEFITCPECGTSINVPALVAAQWRAPWYRAPLYNTLAWPLAWGFLALVASLAGLIAVFPRETPPEWLLYLILLVALGGWALVLFLVRRKFGTNEGVWLSLLLHGCFFGYLFGITGSVGMIIKAVVDFGRYRWLIPYDALWLAVFIAMFIAARMGERFVGRRCIRRRLRLKAAGGTMPA